MDVKTGKKGGAAPCGDRQDAPKSPKEPQRAPSKNESRGWGPLKESRKQQPALQIDDHALRARGTVADLFIYLFIYLCIYLFI